jgi:hypothetical protein
MEGDREGRGRERRGSKRRSGRRGREILRWCKGARSCVDVSREVCAVVCLCQCLCVRYLGTITTTLSGAEERTYADSTAGRFLGRGGEGRGDR